MTLSNAFSIRRCSRPLKTVAAGLFAVLLSAPFAQAQTAEALSAEKLTARVAFEPELGAWLPLHLLFQTAYGASLSLSDLTGERPTLLVPGYYHCAGLCGALRAGVAQAVARSGLKPGRDFNLVLFSIDPKDNPDTALAVQQHDAKTFADAHVADWLYLTGTEASSATLAAALGFRYVFDSRSGQFNHAAGIVLLTPQGRIVQNFSGVQFAPQTLRLALIAASQGEIGNVVDRLVLLCSHYDASTGRYSPLIERLLTGLSLGSALLLGAGIVLLRRRERARATRGQS